MVINYKPALHLAQGQTCLQTTFIIITHYSPFAAIVVASSDSTKKINNTPIDKMPCQVFNSPPTPTNVAFSAPLT